MDLLAADSYEIARLVLQRGIAAVYVLAFIGALNQFPALLGERGLQPAPLFLTRRGFREAPSLFQWGYSDRKLRMVAGSGLVGSTAALVGLTDLVPWWVALLVWLALWALYLSIVNIGQTFYSFGWESLLCEAGFLVGFLGNASIAPPVLILWVFRWLLFRLEFGAGLIKMRGDLCWRRLTCLDYHHETQPLPNPLSWWFHHLPRPLHRIEVGANHFAQLIVPFGLFGPQPVAGISAVIIVVTQAYLMVSGNYAWLNLLTLILAAAAIPDSWYPRVLTDLLQTGTVSVPHQVLAIGVAAMVLWLSRKPLMNLVSSRQLMNYSFNRFHLVNTYGAFGTVTRDRYELVIEGRREGDAWTPYEFRAKPGDPRRRPRQVAPYHLRIDWLMWFAALSPDYARGWFTPLVQRLLEGDHATLRLVGDNPFGPQPPSEIRVRTFLYRFATPAERRQQGVWWVRHEAGIFMPPVRLNNSGELVPA